MKLGLSEYSIIVPFLRKYFNTRHISTLTFGERLLINRSWHNLCAGIIHYYDDKYRPGYCSLNWGYDNEVKDISKVTCPDCVERAVI